MQQSSPLSSVDAQDSSRVSGLRSNQEWLLLCKSQPNVLIEGEECRVEETIIALTPHLKPLARFWSPDSPLEVSVVQAGTVTLRGVEQLSIEDQERLMFWLRGTDPESVQVISTTNVNLYQKVCQGLFRRDLYYYLNTVRLDLR